jgi:streptogramin lyase
MIADWHLAPRLSILPLLLFTACAAPTPPAPAPTAAPSATATVVLPPIPTPLPTPTLTLFPGLRLPPTITELVKGFGGPDDLALMPDGTILFSDIGNGTINQIGADGKVTTILRGLDEPEGVVALQDGALIVVEQGKNRLVHFRLNTGQPVTTWLQLENKTGNAGADGIVRDAATGDIIIPDSPNGRVLRVSADAKNIRVLVTGLLRPTGAAIDRDGSLIVADENANTVQHVRANGHFESLGHFATPDDVVVDGAGNIFVASLGDDSIRMIDAHDGAVRLVANIRDPQGIVVEADGNLVVAEYGLNRIVRLAIH